MDQAIYEIPPRGSLPNRGTEEVGGKAWNLMRMGAAGLPVPQAFVLSTEWCSAIRAGLIDEAQLAKALDSGLNRIEATTGLRFGSAGKPLLVSVRSGAPVSMPGMLETVLDIGLNLEIVDGLIGRTGNPRLAWDSYRRLVRGYSEIVEALPPRLFDQLLECALSNAGVESEQELDHIALRQLTRQMLERFRDLTGVPFPHDPREQLLRASMAVLRSWSAPKAVSYRRINGIGEDAGTALTVQTMVFGNAGGASGSGVGFTRNPATGEPELFLDFRFNTQGEDIVAGRGIAQEQERLRRTLPSVWRQLEDLAHTLETLFRDAQDFEFTLQSDVLYILQSRDAKRTPWAALRIATEMVKEGIASGAIALGPETAKHLANAGTPVILDPARGCDSRYRRNGNSHGHSHFFRQPHFARRGSRAATRKGMPGRLPGPCDRSRPATLQDRRTNPERRRGPIAGW
jgi:pyruvate,orthophosphate dikinase